LGFQGALSKLIPEYLEKGQHSKIVSLTRFSQIWYFTGVKNKEYEKNNF